MKHTKGNWEIQKGTSGVTGEFIRIHSDNATIAKICLIDEVEANAKLIAAAPELLEALIEAKINWKGDKLIGGTYEKMNNAINKAQS